jgi:hypothetical protein
VTDVSGTGHDHGPRAAAGRPEIEAEHPPGFDEERDQALHEDQRFCWRARAEVALPSARRDVRHGVQQAGGDEQVVMDPTDRK